MEIINMNWDEFFNGFLKYWTQIVVFVGAIGFILKFVLENRSKRQYKKFEIFEQAKLTATIAFIESFYMLYYHLSDLSSEMIKTNDILVFNENYKKDFHRKLSSVISFCKEDQHEPYIMMATHLTSAEGWLMFYNGKININKADEAKDAYLHLRKSLNESMQYCGEMSAKINNYYK